MTQYAFHSCYLQGIIPKEIILQGLALSSFFCDRTISATNSVDKQSTGATIKVTDHRNAGMLINRHKESHMMNMVKRTVCAFFLVLLVLSSTGAADETKTGIVLLHGKDGIPSLLSGLADALKKNGFIVTVPEMPYSRYRGFDKAYEDTVSEIDRAIAEIRSKGAKRIFIAGHSLGANVALYYGTKVQVDGIVAVAPGHAPEAKRYASSVGGSVETARKMVSEGNGDKIGIFDDYNQGKRETRKVTAKIYLSYTDPQGPAVMPTNAAALKPGTALLWVVGTQDPMYQSGPSYAFEKAPPNQNNKYVVVDSNHMNTPNVAAEEIVAWLKAFKGSTE